MTAKRSLSLSSLAILALAALIGASSASATTYTVDAAHTSVSFGVRHMTVSTVHGRFTEVSGSAEVDEENLAASSISVSIGAASVDTGNENRDDHLRNEDFLDAPNHPDITFVSTSIEAGMEEGEFLVTGDLTIRGTTNQVQIPVTVAGPIDDPRGGRRMGVEGEITIDRQAWGVSFSRLLDNGGLVVGNDVNIRLGVELTAPAE